MSYVTQEKHDGIQRRSDRLAHSVHSGGDISANYGLAELAVFCDYRITAPLAAGEMVIAREQHGWSDDRIVADLPELVSGHHAGAGSESGRRFFRSIGLGIEDLAIAALLL